MVETAGKAASSILQQLPDVFCQGLFQQLRFILDTFTKEVVTPTEAEREAKRELFNGFAEFLRRAMQDRIAIAVAGSTAYEVDAKNSDLDVVLLTSWGAPNYVLQSVVHYLTMTQAVQTRNLNWPLRNVHLQLVDSARVPVLIVTTPGGLVCDVSVNTVNSIKHTEYFKRVLASTPHLRPFLRLVKYWTKARRLPATREGGLPGILWMILGCTYGSCSMPAFLKICSNAPTARNAHRDSIQRVLPSLDLAVPIFAKLFRFFYLCSSRELMARSISSSQKVCYTKRKEEVAARVASATNYYGVWDEVVSIEDPSGCGEPEPPGNTIWLDKGPPPGATLEPGGTKDLASKASAATWLVYLVELRRANVLSCKVIHFIDEARKRVRKLPLVIQQHQQHNGDNKRRFRLLTDSNTESNSNAHEFVARTFRHLISALFRETIPDRYLLPGCDEQLRKFVETENREQPGSPIYLAWGADKVTARGPSDSKLHPFCFCCSQATTDFALILCHGRVHLVKLTSICTDWSTWWTRSFLSRRDSRSVVHGTLYSVVAPQEYLSLIEAADPTKSIPATIPPTTRDVKDTSASNEAQPQNDSDHNTSAKMTDQPVLDESTIIHDETVNWRPPQSNVQTVNPTTTTTTSDSNDRFREVVLPPSHFPTVGGASTDYYALLFDDTERSSVPFMLVPVRRPADLTPIEVLFHPCHFICRLRGWQVTDEEAADDTSNSQALVAKEVFYAESDEVNFIKELSSICAEAPWYANAANNEHFQPPAAECARCGIDGDPILGLDCYDPAIGAIGQRAVKADVCRFAWRRWQKHADRTRPSHAARLGERTLARKAAEDAEKAPHIVPELSRATELLSATMENMQRNKIRSSSIATAANRARSTPVGNRRSIKDLL